VRAQTHVTAAISTNVDAAFNVLHAGKCGGGVLPMQRVHVDNVTEKKV
jgi:hypothetical protein